MISRSRLVSEVILAASRSSGLAPFGAPEIWANTLAIVPPFSQASPACTFSMASRIVSLTGGEMHNPKTNDERWADEVPLGLRGGEHISLEVTERGASVEYNCAHGTTARNHYSSNAGDPGPRLIAAFSIGQLLLPRQQRAIAAGWSGH